MDIRRKDIKIFMDLRDSNKGLLGFTLSRRYDMEPREIIDFILLYQDKEFITCDDEYKIVITEKGRETLKSVLSNMRQTPIREHSTYFEEQSSPFKLAINEPYIPNKDFLENRRNRE